MSTEVLTFDTSWGRSAVALCKGKIVGLVVPTESTREFQRKLKQLPESHTAHEAAPRHPIVKQVREYLDGKRSELELPVDLSPMTPFQREILAACARIPAGQTRSYSELAADAGRPGAARAVGNTMALNPIPLAIPCHRVLRSDGSLGGYSGAGGLRTKQRLLEHERNLVCAQS